MGGDNVIIKLLRELFPRAFDGGGTAQAHTQTAYVDISHVVCAAFTLPSERRASDAAAAASATLNGQPAAAAAVVTWGKYLRDFAQRLETLQQQLESLHALELYFDHDMPPLKDAERASRRQQADARADAKYQRLRTEAAQAGRAEPPRPASREHNWPKRTAGDEAAFARTDWFPYDAPALSMDDVKSSDDARVKFDEMLTLFMLGGSFECDPGVWRPFVRPGCTLRIVGGVLAAQRCDETLEVQCESTAAAATHVLKARTVLGDNLPLTYGETDIGLCYRMSLRPHEHALVLANDIDVFVALLHYRRMQVATLGAADCPTLIWRRPGSGWDKERGEYRNDYEYIDIGVLYDWLTLTFQHVGGGGGGAAATPPVDAVSMLALLVAMQGTDYTDKKALTGCTCMALWQAFLDRPCNVVEIGAPSSLVGMHEVLRISINHAHFTSWIRHAYATHASAAYRNRAPSEQTMVRLARQSLWYLHYFINGWKRNAHVPTGFERSPDGRYALFGWKRGDPISAGEGRPPVRPMVADDSVERCERYEIVAGSA